MKKKFLLPFLENSPTSWAIIRACEAQVLSNVKFTKPILEVGCGDGMFSQVLFADKEVIDTAIDIDIQEIKRAKKYEVFKKTLKMNVYKMSFKKRSFKTVFSNGVLEHIPNLPQALNEINRVLAKNGKLIITCPTKNLTSNLLIYNLLYQLRLKYLAQIYGFLFNKLFKHVNLYSKKEWEEVLAKSGFRLKKFTYYNTPKIIQLHELLLPFAIFSKITKKYFNTMVIFKGLRKKIFVRLWYRKLLKIPYTSSKKQVCSSALIVAVKK